MDLTGATRLLDIGTGTGLLALMAAQRHATVEIEAIEIEAAAAIQAAANVAASPWGGRIHVAALSLAQYAASRPSPFSHIICNPPFFHQALPSANAARSTARHEGATSLSFGEIAVFAAQFLEPAGQLTVLLPPSEMQLFATEAETAGLFPQTRLVVRHRLGGRVTRHISCFGCAATTVVETALLINAGDEYSAEFRALLTGFYLAL